IRDFHVTGVQTCALPILPPDDHQETGDPNDLLLDCYMALPGGAMVRSKVFQQAGFFEERFRAGQDHDMVLRIAEIAPYKFLKGRSEERRVGDECRAGRET